MDDLLALFGEIPPGEAAEEISSSSAMQPATQSNLVQHKTPSHANESQNKQESRGSPSQHEKRVSSISSNVDERVGFRISNRLLSSMDLLDLISSNPFHSPASLSAMSLKQLNALMVNPAQVLDKATVAGKTNLMTVGLVFHNTGTRIASSGNAFALATIGTLRSGHCVSVLLFGSVYSKFCRKLVPGKAVAILYPRLVPPKDDSSSDTSITFSLNDEKQLVMLGTATDFGMCQARIRGKNEKGIWVSDARRCKNYVDMTICQYCHTHRSQANGGGGKKAAVAQLRMQELRQQASIRTVRNGEKIRNDRTMNIMPNNHLNDKNIQHVSRFSNTPAFNEPFAFLASRKAHYNFLQQHSSSLSGNGSNVNQQTPHGLACVPQSLASIRGNLPQSNHTMNSRQVGLSSKVNTKVAASKYLLSTPRCIQNPYGRRTSTSDKGKSMPVVTPAVDRRRQATEKKNETIKIANLISSGKRSKDGDKGLLSKKRRTINTVGVSGFDGSVVVPRPKRLMASSSLPFGGESRVPTMHNRKDEASILEKQKELAAKLNSQMSQASGNLGKAKLKRCEEDKASAIPGEGWCKALNSEERERLRNVKSAFATEADAEEFAHKRRAVVDLEKEEERKTKRTQGQKAGPNEKKRINKVWRCLTCQHLFQYYPQRCYGSAHDVATVRELNGVATTEQKRTELSNKAAEEGGLKLGSGIEWTRWNRFS